MSITAQIEEYGEQFAKAKPLGPWKVQGIASSPSDAVRKLEKELQKRFTKKPDPEALKCELPDTIEAWRTTLKVVPSEQSVNWLESVPVEVECFRWTFPDGRSLVRVPAVNCVLLAKTVDLTAEEIKRQAQVALTRLAKESDLLTLRQKFAARRFSFQVMYFDLPVDDIQDEPQPGKKPRIKTLRSCATELRIGNLPATYGLDASAQELAEHFKGEKPQSVLLVGPAGVGKTALVQHFVKNKQGLGLGHRSVWTTSGARIVSGMSGLGMWQDRCSKLIRQANSIQAIVHLGSLFELIEAGKIDGQPGVASMVRSAIDRRRMLAIAECTPEQLGVIEKDDPMLLRVFSRIELKEPEKKQTVEILRQHASEVAADYSEQALLELFHLHKRFATYSAMPSTALRLMRTLEDHHGDSHRKAVSADDVAEAFSKQTGLPRFLIDDSVPLDLQQVEGRLAANVIGQEEPIQLVVDLLATLKARLVRPGKPLASLLFIGPTGVGKTEMAKAIARLMYNDPSRMLRIDMSEYSSPWSIAKLIGKPGEHDGALTSPIREQPFTVVLLDEFEKADPNVFDLLLQVLGEGRLTDSQGQLADFRNAIVIMTSNLGADTFKDSQFGFGAEEKLQWRKHFERELRSFVRPEFLARIDTLVPFQPLPLEAVRKIALRELAILKQRTGLKYANINLEFTEEAVDQLCASGYQPKFGARPLRRAIEEQVTIPLADCMSGMNLEQAWSIQVSAKDKAISMEARQFAVEDATSLDSENEIQLVNEWMQLGAMARAAKNCELVREVQNRIARDEMRANQLKKRISEASGPTRIAAYREDLAKCQSEIHNLSKVRNQLFTCSDLVQRQQLDLMLAWHRMQAIDAAEFEESLAARKIELKQSVENVLNGQLASTNRVTLLVVCKSAKHLKTPFEAYIKLAESNRWQCEAFLVKSYDGRLDVHNIVDYRQPFAAGKTQPEFTLMSRTDEDGYREKYCDLFRLTNLERKEFDDCLGFALHFSGDGVAAWLREEHRVVHFFDPTESGAKRRIRLRVDAFEGKLTNIELENNWLDMAADPTKYHMRQFNFGEQIISNSRGQSLPFSKDNQAEALLDLILIEHEVALWKNVGYHGIPFGARLSPTKSSSQV